MVLVQSDVACILEFAPACSSHSERKTSVNLSMQLLSKCLRCPPGCLSFATLNLRLFVTQISITAQLLLMLQRQLDVSYTCSMQFTACHLHSAWQPKFRENKQHWFLQAKWHPVIQPTVSKHWRRLRALTSTNSHASFFLHPLQGSWWKRHFSLLLMDSPMPVKCFN